MYIKNLKIKNFRLIENLDIELNKNINVFIGNNAQGKTSILESIYLLALTKSFRNVENEELITKQQEFTRINAIVKSDNKTKKMGIILDKNNKTLKLNGKEIKKVSSYISTINVIMFSPDDLDIVKKSPGIRRTLLNIELCQLFPSYVKILNEYNKLLKMRNEYIKKKYEAINRDYLNILTDKLLDRAIVIMDYREKFIANINNHIDNTFYKIMKEKGLQVSYEPNLISKDKEVLTKFFYDNFFNEINKKSTLFGPHRDDFSFILNEDDLKTYGSQGQQRVAILAFKLAEINLFMETKKSYPIVLLDDIFSELDIEKRNNLLKFIKSKIQFIITTTDINNISKKILDKSDVFKVKNGIVTR